MVAPLDQTSTESVFFFFFLFVSLFQFITRQTWASVDAGRDGGDDVGFLVAERVSIL